MRMPPKVVKSTQIQIPMSAEVDSWLRREAELRGLSRGAYLSSLLEAFYEGRGHTLQRKAGTENELCLLMYNTLQGLYFLRESLSEKTATEIEKTCRKTMEVIAGAREFMDKRRACIGKLELDSLLDNLLECVEVLDIVRVRLQDPLLKKRVEDTARSCEGLALSYRKR